MAQNVNIELIIEAGKSASTLGEIKQSIKDVTKALTDVKVGSKEFHELVEVLQDAKGNVKELRNESATLQNVANVAKIFTSSFAVATSAMSAFGAENEEVTKSLKKVEAAFVLMESVRAFAEALKKAKEANDTFNASLLTNPYLLVAVAVAGLALAIYEYSDETAKAIEKTKKLGEATNALSQINLDRLKHSIEGYTEGQDKAIKNAQQQLDILTTTKASEEAILAAKLKVIALEKQGSEENTKRIKAEGQAEIDNYEFKVKAVANTKEAIIQLQQTKDKLEERSYFLRTSAENQEILSIEDRIKKFQAYVDVNEKSLATDKERVELLKNNKDKTDESDKLAELAILDYAQKKVEAARQKAQDELDKSLTKTLDKYHEQKELDDETVTLLQLQVEKESDLAAINDFNITNNERYKKGIEESITAIQTKVDAEQKEYDAIKKKTLLTDKEKDFVETYDKQAAALKELKAQQSEVNQAIAIGYINRDKFTKAGNQKLALKDLEEAENAYRKLAEERKQAVDVEAASGQYQDIIAKKNLQNIKDEISDLQQLWILTKNSTISDEDKKAKLDGITRALTGLNRQAQILQAGIKATNKQHFFTASQLKDVQKAISFIQAAENTIAKFGQLATQITQQNADKRIAIYQAENDAYTEGLKGRLEAGFISQQEYDRKKAEADKVLQKKKQEEQHKAFVAQKAVAIVQATISTALAVVNALATAPTFIAGIVFAALAAAAGAAEIAVIATQKEPTALASGGIFQGSGTVTGNGGSRDDSVNARLSNGESVMNAKSTRAFAPLLSAMNQMGGGVAFAGTPTIQNAPTGVSSNGTASPSPASPTKVYVTESDITRTQNKVSVIQKRSTW